MKRRDFPRLNDSTAFVTEVQTRLFWGGRRLRWRALLKRSIAFGICAAVVEVSVSELLPVDPVTAGIGASVLISFIVGLLDIRALRR